MTTNGITSTPSALVQLVQQSHQSQQARFTEAAQAAAEGIKTKPSHQPRPVTNMQGQRTGTIVNVTA